MTYIQRQQPKTQFVPQSEFLPLGIGISNSTSTISAANEAVFIPLTIDRIVTAVAIYLFVGGPTGGNWDVGIYNESGTRLASAGSTAASGTGAKTFTISVSLARGRYYVGYASDSTTNGLYCYSQSGFNVLTKKQSSAFPLPSTATFASGTQNDIPMMAIGFS